jgi:RimJ/RimL family protein N-acetyltransferase
MLQWGFNEFKLDEITGTVLKSNQASLLIHKRLHFRETKNIPLVTKISTNGEISLVDTPSAEDCDDVNVYISLKKEDFKYRK